MNKARRKEIEDIISQLQSLQERLEAVTDEEREYYDNMPQSFQDGSKGDAVQEMISSLESASLEDAINYLSDVASA